jgi:hypothetical protein
MNLATACKCAFKNDPFILSQHIRDDVSGVDIYVGTADDYQVICCWGSTEIKDWITNFKFFFKKMRLPAYAAHDSPVRVHSGYLEGWERIRSQVLSSIHGSKILVTGYSMGGGLSSIVAVDVQYNVGPADLICVDIDGPRVWNRAGRRSFNHRVPRSYKIAYGNDIVPKIPMWYRYGGLRLRVGPAWRWWRLSTKDHIAVQDSDTMLVLLKKTIPNDI